MNCRAGDDVCNQARFEDAVGIFPEFIDGHPPADSFSMPEVLAGFSLLLEQGFSPHLFKRHSGYRHALSPPCKELLILWGLLYLQPYTMALSWW